MDKTEIIAYNVKDNLKTVTHCGIQRILEAYYASGKEKVCSNMYNHQLKTFLEVAEAGSFAGAASKLYISSSAVVQQINNLEQDLKVSLFIRSKKGVCLTEAGEYLLVRVREIVRDNELLRQRLIEIDTRNKAICIGTSMFEKCRLLYELWVLYSMENKKYEIRMITLDEGYGGLRGADLVECVQNCAPWQKDMEFLELCRIPYSFAVAKSHPFADKKSITLADIKGQTIAVLRQGTADPVNRVCHVLEEAGADMRYYDAFSPSVIWDCSYYRWLLLIPAVWEDIIFDMTVKPCRWDYTVPYGIFYRKDLSAPAAEFLSFIRDTYREDGSSRIVPVL